MRAEKQFLLDEVKDKMVGAKAIVIARYKKLEPNIAAPFRMDLAQTGGVLEVVRKRLLLKAAESLGFSIDSSWLGDGHIAVIAAKEDAVATTKVIYQFCQQNEAVLEIVGGQFEGQVCVAKDFEEIAKLPSQDVMRSQFLSVLEAPMSQTLAVMEALLTSVLYCVDNRSQQENT